MSNTRSVKTSSNWYPSTSRKKQKPKVKWKSDVFKNPRKLAVSDVKRWKEVVMKR